MQCVNGHQISEGQKFCPECGAPARPADPVTGPSGDTTTPAYTPAPDPAAAATEDTDGTPASVTDPQPDPDTGPDTDPTAGKSRRGLIIGGTVIGLLVAVLLWAVIDTALWSARKTNADDTNGTTSSQSAPRQQTTPLERCMTDTIDFLNEAVIAHNSGDEMFIWRRYGSEDPRTVPLAQLNSQFQADVYRFGENKANLNHRDRVEAYCQRYELSDEYGNPDGWVPVD